MNFESNWLQREPGEVIAQHRGIEGEPAHLQGRFESLSKRRRVRCSVGLDR